MDTDRREELESPVIEDFLDCDKLGIGSDGDSSSNGSSSSSSSSPSPRRSLKRLHIHVDMTETQYLTPAAHHPDRAPTDGLPICTSGSQTGAYSSPDLDPYSAVSGVSSFNYPAAADPSLLTPASSAGSPPLQHRQSTKPLRSYHPSQPSTLGSQAPTPPDTSKMYGYSSYDVNSSHSPSPMTVNPAATEAPYSMPPYMAHSPPGSHHPSSPVLELPPPPIDPYLGHFTVSGASDGEVTHQSLQEYHPYGVPVATPGSYLDHPHDPVGTPHLHHRLPPNGAAPVLSQPHPSHFRPQSAPQVGSIEDLRDPSLLYGPYQPPGALSPGRRPQPRKKPSPSRKPSRTPKATPHVGPDPNGQFKQEEDGEELTLRDDAPEDDKYLFQLRKQFLSEKGKGMWEEMKAKYSEKHQGNWEKAALQMKVSRAVARYGVWPEKEVQRLKEAFDYVEEMRYQLIIARMKEMGGCRVWDWKKPHIIAMLVKLGLEEETVNEKTGSRRRKQKAAARRQGSPQVSAAMGDWSNGLGLHPPPPFPGHGHAHHVAAGMMGDDFHHPPGGPIMTSKQEEDLINQIYSEVKAERSLSPDDDGMDGLSYDQHQDTGSRRPSAANHHASARVAQQACTRMLRQPASQIPGYGTQ